MALPERKKKEAPSKTGITIYFNRDEYRRLKSRAALIGKKMTDLGRVGLRKELRRQEVLAEES